MAKTQKNKRISKPKKSKIPPPTLTESHPWRMCPPGESWVRTHPLHTQPSEQNPEGLFTTRSGHCRKNTASKDSMYDLEIKEIAEKYFSKLSGAPAPNNLGFAKGNDFDALIRGWVKYWNDIFKPKEPLDPDLIKALIATESSFKPETTVKVGKTRIRAYGLMQVTSQTQKILGDTDGELKDHLVHVDQQDLTDPNLNICNGVRWLFRKKEIADSKADRELTWREAIQEYKAEKKGSKLVNRVFDYYDKLKKDYK